MTQVKTKQRDRSAGCAQIRPSKGKMFGQREQQQEKERERDADQAVLHRVDGQALEHFKQREGCESEHHKQKAVFHRTLGLLVDVDRGDQTQTAGLCLQLFGRSGRVVALRKIAGEMAGLPVCGKTVLADLVAAGQDLAVKARMRPA